MWNVKPEVTDLQQPALPKSAVPTGIVGERRMVAWVGSSVVFKGELVSSEDMTIDGRLEGAIDLRNNDLVVGPNANLKADIVAKSITVRGTVTGTLTASDRIEICETATIEGDMSAPRFAIKEGATIQGHVQTALRQPAVEVNRPQLVSVG
jgi:cytoskeletal protein CcmA (bactofilin family)